MNRDSVLVIEDEADLREVLTYNLRREGYQVAASANGAEGLQRVQEEGPDLVILDLMLPDLDGLEICQRIRRDPKRGRTPIIMVTAKGDESDVVLGLGVGADDYMTKAVQPQGVDRAGQGGAAPQRHARALRGRRGHHRTP